MLNSIKSFAASIMMLSCFCAGVLADEPVAVKAETITVTVGNEVKNKSKCTLPKGATLIDALNATGSFDEFGGPNHARLIRGGKLTIVNLRKLRHDLPGGLVLVDGDSVQLDSSIW